jgi:hypothetical protein
MDPVSEGSGLIRNMPVSEASGLIGTMAVAEGKGLMGIIVNEALFDGAIVGVKT